MWGERKWRIINHKNFAVKVKLAFLMAPFGSVTQSAPSLSIDKCRAIHFLVVSPATAHGKIGHFDNLPPVVKLGDERGPAGINILAV